MGYSRAPASVAQCRPELGHARHDVSVLVNVGEADDGKGEIHDVAEGCRLAFPCLAGDRPY